MKHGREPPIPAPSPGSVVATEESASAPVTSKSASVSNVDGSARVDAILFPGADGGRAGTGLRMRRGGGGIRLVAMRAFHKVDNLNLESFNQWDGCRNT